VSLVVHAVLLTAAGHIRTRPVERTFFAPVQMVDLVERFPGPSAKTPAPAAAPPAARPKVPAKPVVAQPPPARPKPKITREAVERLLAKPAAAEKPAPPRGPATEEQISERIARMREKYAEPPPPSARAAGAEQPTGDGRRVEDAIASIRQRVGPAGAGPVGSGSNDKVGVRGGSASTLQQVRLRAYYNQLWNHVTDYWTIPPSLQGRDYAVIVSVILDRQGTLVRSWVEKPSGSEAFDQSALRALQRAQPLPPIPDSVSGDTLEVGFRFYPD
jgi:TonB family protein